jgi:hypothetical protein
MQMRMLGASIALTAARASSMLLFRHSRYGIYRENDANFAHRTLSEYCQYGNTVTGRSWGEDEDNAVAKQDLRLL